MKKIIIASAVALFVLTGCNAIKGLGKDVSQGGEVISNTATNVEQKL